MDTIPSSTSGHIVQCTMYMAPCPIYCLCLPDDPTNLEPSTPLEGSAHPTPTALPWVRPNIQTKSSLEKLGRLVFLVESLRLREMRWTGGVGTQFFSVENLVWQKLKINVNAQQQKSKNYVEFLWVGHFAVSSVCAGIIIWLDGHGKHRQHRTNPGKYKW